MKVAVFVGLLVTLASAQAQQKLSVVSLGTVLTDLAQSVGGDRVAIISLVKPGQDPHDFEPAPGDVTAISQAQVVLASGLGMESYLDKLQQAAGNGPVFLIVGEKVKSIPAPHEAEDEHDGHAHGEAMDPHWWHSISNTKLAVRAIRDAFVTADPADTSVFEANTAATLAKLDDLAKWVRIQIAKLPENKRILVTSHDALGYFAHDYGFEIRPVQGISTGDQPSSKKVRDLIAAIKDEQVKAIFTENMENPKVLTEILKDTGAKLGGTLYADGLGETEGNTYDSMMRHNVTTIVEGLR
jgi:zinc/manganese transport system substrate-binding protein